MSKSLAKKVKIDGKLVRVRVSRWFVPYVKRSGKDRTTLKLISKAKCGVYLIRNKRTKEILYTGYSGSQLYKTIYRHYQSWVDRQYRATYGKYSTEIIVISFRSCDSKSALRLEEYYRQQFKPKDNINSLDEEISIPDFDQVPKVNAYRTLGPDEIRIPDVDLDMAPF